ncbi:MAG TPA: hypothetical protein VD978_20355 [Azospirillum sp.]|nr:hypothetical protein [Azospirillum sp.]
MVKIRNHDVDDHIAEQLDNAGTADEIAGTIRELVDEYKANGREPRIVGGCWDEFWTDVRLFLAARKDNREDEFDTTTLEDKHTPLFVDGGGWCVAVIDTGDLDIGAVEVVEVNPLPPEDRNQTAA